MPEVRTRTLRPPETASTSLRELRRGQVLAMARTLVAREGLEALTIAGLEERLAFSRGVITYHFRNKDEIVRALLETSIAEIDAATQAGVDATAGAVERVKVVVRQVIGGFLGRPEACSILCSFWGRLSSEPWAQKANAALFATYRKRTRSLLEAGRKSGELDLSPGELEGLSAVVVGLVLGVVTQSVFQPGAIDVPAAVAEAERMVVDRLTRRR